jgi:guanylate kinase
LSSSSERPRGLLYIISGPSGSGKNTVIQALAARRSEVAVGTTATTRPPRTGEVDGRDYFFLSRDEFMRRIEAAEFIEWAEVHRHHLYGTPRSELERLRAEGRDVLLQIDVQGMRSIRRSGMDAIAVFLKPPDMETLERRLRARGTEDENLVQRRLATAREEMEAESEFDYAVVNDSVEHAVDQLEHIIDRRRQHAASRSGAHREHHQENCS